MTSLAGGIAAFLVGLLTLGSCPAHAQRQLPDPEYEYANDNPAYSAGEGPELLLSTTNSDYVRRGSLDPFAAIAASDGFSVRRQSGDLADALDGFRGILVIANPYLENYRQFPAMEPPSAFSDEEIEVVRSWVENGGSLLLLADHAPLGGGSSQLAAAFGFTFLNGHVADTDRANAGSVQLHLEFAPGNGLNSGHPITDGSTGREKTKRFYCFGGQAFIPAEGAQTLLTIPGGWVAVFTYRITEEINTALRIDASGMSQGATLEYGEGRIAVFGEAGAFTAQIIDGTFEFGVNTPEGADNPEFVISTLRWLARFEPGG